MAIESEMRALTEALKEHTAALNSFVKASGKGGGGSASTSDAGTKASGTGKATGSGNKPKKLKVEDVQKKFGDYLAVTGDERKERVGIIKKINEHFEVAKMTDADPEVWPKAFAILDRVIEGEDIDDILGEDGEGDEDDSPI